MPEGVSSRIPSPAQPEAIQRFWDKYLALLHRGGVKPPADRWYVRRAELYIESVPGRRLGEHRPAGVTGHLADLGRPGRMEDWQFRQAVDALQKLFELVGVSWLHEVDWRYWRESARSLPADHPTIARSLPLRDGASADASHVPAEETAVAAGCAVIERLVAVIRQRNYSIRTEEAYRSWTHRFLTFIGDRDPGDAGATEVAAFLETLAVQGNVAASTQNQALNALVFVYEQVLERPLGDMGTFQRAKRPRRLPVVLTQGEVGRLLANIEGTYHLMASLLYGTGMRLMECLRLRVKDVDCKSEPRIRKLWFRPAADSSRS